MNAETNQAVEIIKQKASRIALIGITNIYERGIVEYLMRFAFDKSNPRDSWRIIRNNAIDQLGKGATTEQVDHESEILFHVVVKHHFDELTDPQINALFQSFKEAVIKGNS
jgi:hypothetical protein